MFNIPDLSKREVVILLHNLGACSGGLDIVRKSSAVNVTGLLAALTFENSMLLYFLSNRLYGRLCFPEPDAFKRLITPIQTDCAAQRKHIIEKFNNMYIDNARHMRNIPENSLEYLSLRALNDVIKARMRGELSVLDRQLAEQISALFSADSEYLLRPDELYLVGRGHDVYYT